MIGRQRELEQLLEVWRKTTQEQRCTTVQVVGEAGVGKTRLIREFCRDPSVSGATILRMNCLEIFATTPLYPAGSVFWSRLGLAAGDDEATRTEKISAYLGRRDIDTPANRLVLASLLGFASDRTGGRQSGRAAGRQARAILLRGGALCADGRRQACRDVDRRCALARSVFGRASAPDHRARGARARAAAANHPVVSQGARAARAGSRFPARTASARAMPGIGEVRSRGAGGFRRPAGPGGRGERRQSAVHGAARDLARQPGRAAQPAGAGRPTTCRSPWAR